MQRGSSSLRGTCRRCDSLRRHSIPCEISLKRGLSSSIHGGVQRCSYTRPILASLPLFDFLHPRVVRDAINSTKRFNGHIRNYGKDAEHNDTEPVPSVEGWSAA